MKPEVNVIGKNNLNIDGMFTFTTTVMWKNNLNIDGRFTFTTTVVLEKDVNERSIDGLDASPPPRTIPFSSDVLIHSQPNHRPLRILLKVFPDKILRIRVDVVPNCAVCLLTNDPEKPNFKLKCCFSVKLLVYLMSL